MADQGGEGASRFTLGWIEKVVGIAIAALSGWSALQAAQASSAVQKQNQELELLKGQVAQAAENRELRKLNHEITIKIFDEVKDVYADKDAKSDRMLNRLLAVSALIEAVPDPAVRSQLAAVVKEAAENVKGTLSPESHGVSVQVAQKSDYIQSRVDQTIFRAEEAETSQGPVQKGPSEPRGPSSVKAPKWSNYDFDFFWCEGGGESLAQRTAQSVAALRALDPEASGRWRVRKLPQSVNAQAGYGVRGNSIRVSAPDERPLAELLKEVVTERQLVPEGNTLEIKNVGAPTPYYLSVFFCPAGAGTSSGD